MSKPIIYAVASVDFSIKTTFESASTNRALFSCSNISCYLDEAGFSIKKHPVDILFFDTWLPSRQACFEKRLGLELSIYTEQLEREKNLKTKLVMILDRLDDFEFMSGSSINKLVVAGKKLNGVIYKADVYSNGFYGAYDFVCDAIKRIADGETFISKTIRGTKFNNDKPAVKFTENEMLLLNLYCKLGSTGRVAEYLGKSKSAIDGSLLNARRRTGVNTINQLITKYYYMFENNKFKSLSVNDEFSELVKKNIAAQTVVSTSTKSKENTRPTLTQKEIELLKVYVKFGKSKAAARFLDVESYEILNAMRRIRKKLGVKNSYQLFYFLKDLGYDLNLPN